jgi:hypothetical protein
LLTSPNSDSRIYREETAALRGMMKQIDATMRTRGLQASIFPGHGDYYAASLLKDK